MNATETKQLSQWEVENNQKHKNTLTFARELAAALGEGYDAQTQDAKNNGEYGRILTPDGLHLFLHIDPYRKRIFIDGDYRVDNRPVGKSLVDYKKSNEELPKISVAMNRPVAAIAGDVKRKLLPAFIAIHATLTERKAEYDEREQRDRTGAREMLAAATAVDPDGWKLTEAKEQGHEHIIEQVHFIEGKEQRSYDNGYVHQIRIHGQATTWELRSLPLPVATRLIAFLAAEWKPKTGS